MRWLLPAVLCGLVGGDNDDARRPFEGVTIWPDPEHLAFTRAGPSVSVDWQRVGFEVTGGHGEELLTHAWRRLTSRLSTLEPGTPAQTFPHFDPVRRSSDAVATAALGEEPSGGFLEGVQVQITSSSDAVLSLGVDESYSISVTLPSSTGPDPSRSKLVVKARSKFGALRALQTIGQLAVWNGTASIIPCLPITIRDRPHAKWRGLLLDTARHFLKLRDMIRVLDTMETMKLNVLHWYPPPLLPPCTPLPTGSYAGSPLPPLP